MATNLIANGDFETGAMEPEWNLTFGNPPIIADANSPFGGVWAMNLVGPLEIIANNSGVPVVIGEKYHFGMHVQLQSGTGSFAVVLGENAPYQGGVITVYSDGTVQYRDGNDNSKILRTTTIPDPTKRFIITMAWETIRVEGSAGLGIAHPGNAIVSSIPSPFNAVADWLVDDVWVGTDPQPNLITKPDNGPGPSIFQTSHFDDIHGTLHKRKDIKVDFDDRLRNAKDPEGIDRDDFSYSPLRRRFIEP